MWKPSKSEIRNVIASEIECDRGNIEDLAERLIERTRIERDRRPRDQWHEAMRDPGVFAAYEREVERQVREMRAVEDQLKDDPPEPRRSIFPPSLSVDARIVDNYNGGRSLAFFHGSTMLWAHDVSTLDADRIASAAATIFRRTPRARICPDTVACPPEVWKIACCHLLPIHLQAEATGDQVAQHVAGLINNGHSVDALGLDDKGDLGNPGWTPHYQQQMQQDLRGDALGQIVRRENDKLRQQLDEAKREIAYQRDRARAALADCALYRGDARVLSEQNKRLMDDLEKAMGAKARRDAIALTAAAREANGAAPMLVGPLPWSHSVEAVARALVDARARCPGGAVVSPGDLLALANCLNNFRATNDRLRNERDAARQKACAQETRLFRGVATGLAPIVWEFRIEYHDPTIIAGRRVVAIRVSAVDGWTPAGFEQVLADTFRTIYGRNGGDGVRISSARFNVGCDDIAAAVALPSGMRIAMIDVVFDGPPGHEAGRFVEVEEGGRSISAGTWIEPDCEPHEEPTNVDSNYWRLRIQALLPEAKDGATG